MQVIAHRLNTLDGIREAWSMGCDLVEVDVYTSADGRLLITRDPAQGGLDWRDVPEDGGLYLDVKNASAEAVAEAVRGREAATWIWSARTEFLAELRALNPALRVMPQAHSHEHLTSAIQLLQPRAVAFAAWDYREDLIRLAQSAGVLTFVDLLKDLDTEAEWQQAVEWGVDGIMTDRPAELLGWLARGYLK